MIGCVSNTLQCDWFKGMCNKDGIDCFNFFIFKALIRTSYVSREHSIIFFSPSPSEVS